MIGSTRIVFSNHAVKQMFQRDISIEDIKIALNDFEIINNYSDDKPYPSKLIFSMVNNRPIHIVYSKNIDDNTIIIITVYEPNFDIWQKDFKTRKK